MRMEAALATLAFVPGLAVGSFLSVVASRVPLRLSVVRPGSACTSCGTAIAWYDNVPLVSFLVLGGRCRQCETRIPRRDPAVELASALLITGCVVAFGPTGTAAVAALFCGALVVVTATDLEHRIVPNRVVLPAAAAVLTLHTVVSPSAEWLLAALGAMLGRTAPLALMLATLLALVPSLVLLARHGLRARKLAIPFAPFLALGSVIALFAGDALLDVYFGVFR